MYYICSFGLFCILGSFSLILLIEPHFACWAYWVLWAHFAHFARWAHFAHTIYCFRMKVDHSFERKSGQCGQTWDYSIFPLNMMKGPI